jgi:hypothetical protein
MAVRISNFSKVFETSLMTAVEGIVSKRSEFIIKEYQETMQDSLEAGAKEWQNDIRKALSKPVIGVYGTSSYVPNTSLFPRMLEGRLVAAIKKPNIKASYTASPQKLRKNQIRFIMSNFYGGRVQTIGNLLDKMTDREGRAKPFAGWIQRANHIWFNIMTERLSNKATNAMYAAKQGF